MQNPYDLHSWSKLYREEALREARYRHLVERTNADRGSWRAGRIWSNALASLHTVWVRD